jgi:hypothetical protein
MQSHPEGAKMAILIILFLALPITLDMLADLFRKRPDPDTDPIRVRGILQPRGVRRPRGRRWAR